MPDYRGLYRAQTGDDDTLVWMRDREKAYEVNVGSRYEVNVQILDATVTLDEFVSETAAIEYMQDVLDGEI